MVRRAGLGIPGGWARTDGIVRLPFHRSDEHSMMGEPNDGARHRSWEVYASMSGVDSLFSGLSKRTPTGGFFTS